MLHTMFRLNWSSVSVKEDYLGAITIYGHGDHLGHVTCIMMINFHFLVHKSFNTKFG